MLSDGLIIPLHKQFRRQVEHPFLTQKPLAGVGRSGLVLQLHLTSAENRRTFGGSHFPFSVFGDDDRDGNGLGPAT